MDRNSPSSRRFPEWLPYVLGAATFAALVLLLASLAIQKEHERRRHFASSVTRNTAMLVGAQLAAVLAQADLELKAAGAAVPPDVDGWAAGLPTSATGLSPQGAPMSLSGPHQTAPNRWVLSFSRPARGSGQPPVSLDVPVEQLGAILDRVDLGRHGAVTIRTASLALVYRHPMPAGSGPFIGDTTVSGELREIIARQPEAGEYVAATSLDGVIRINAYQRVGGYPLYVVVGLPEDDFPSGWDRLDMALIATAAAALLAGGYLALQFSRTSRRKIDRVQRRYQAIVESSRDAIISKTLNGIITSWNPGAEKMFGYSAAEMLGQPATRLFPPELRVEEDNALARLQRGETVEHFGTERLHRDGHRIHVSVTFSPVAAANGRVVGASVIARDITRQKAMEDEMRTLAFKDALTQLPNRRLLLDRMHHAQLTSRRTHEWAAVLFLDLDHFKELNDQHGHDVGDQLLVAVARWLLGAVRESDTVARLGGDEFVVLCENLGQDGLRAREVVMAIEAKIGDAIGVGLHLNDVLHHCRASIGHRLFMGAEDDLDQILHDADSAMYADKQRRRPAQPDTA